MYDEKELEELYDEFSGLDGDMFLEADVDFNKLDNDIMTGSAIKIPSNFKNNNFMGDTGGIRVNKPDVSIQLDLLNQNFIGLNTCEFERMSKSPTNVADLRTSAGMLFRPTLLLDKKGDEVDNELKEVDEKLTSPNTVEKNPYRRIGWASDSIGLWHSGPSSLNLSQPSHKSLPYQDLSSSVSYTSHGPHPFTSFSSSAKRTYSHQQLGAKVEMVYSLLSMLDTDNREDMSKTFLAMSSSSESCHAMRQSGCLPLLIQLIYSSELDKEVRNRAAEALHNIVHAQSDEKRRKREVRVLKLLEQVREYCDELGNYCAESQSQISESDKHPVTATGTLMKLSFDAEHRQAICLLGGLHAITDLIQVDHKYHGSSNNDSLCITLRRYAGMSLTNLTFGDGKNKALLCSFSKFLLALVDQLKSPSEDLRQVTASVLRNLSWRADSESKQALRNVGAVTALTISAMEAKKESTLKSILSALWNLSAHCSLNKIDICSVPGSLAFLVKMLKYKSASNTLSIIENAGGILRNVSSHVAVREDYRQVLRDNCCFEVLLEQLKSPSLTIVSNACGTLWNLSARCSEDQKRLWEMGATSMLRSLVQSKHKMISMGSSAALKNLLAANPNENLLSHLDSTAKSLGLQNLPTLFVRKKRALEQELNITLAETCDNIEPVASSSQTSKLEDRVEGKNTDGPKRSESRDSVKSTQSDTVYELLNQIAHANEDKAAENTAATLHSSLDEKLMSRRTEDQRITKSLRSTTSMIPTPTSKKINQDRINEKTKEETTLADDSIGVLTDIDFKEHVKSDSKQRNRKGIPVLKTKPKRILQDEDSREHRTSSRLSGEYLIQNEKTEFERENDETLVENYRHTVDSVLSSHKAMLSPHLNYSKCTEEESDNVDDIDGIQELPIARKESDTEIKEEQEGRMYSEDPASNENSSNQLKNALDLSDKSFCAKIRAVDGEMNSKESHNNFIPSSIKMDITKHRTDKSQYSSQTIQHVPQYSNSNPDESISANDESLSLGYNNKNSKKADLQPNNSAAQTLEKQISHELFPSRRFSGSNWRKSIQENSHEFDKGEENKSGFVCRKNDLGDDEFELNGNFVCANKLLNEKAGSPQVSPSCTLSGSNDGVKKSHHVKTFSTSNDEEVGCPDADNPVKHADRIAASLNSNEMEGTSDRSPLPYEAVQLSGRSSNVTLEEVDLKLNSCIFPKFKVGSPITDAKVIQMEARKICGEIQKDLDLDMGCSLTSEVSLVSCSSFLDTGDFSLFDCSNDAVNFEDSEMVRTVSKSKNHSFSKSVSQAAESVSLPSLGSLKNEQIEAFDLDNSVLSVASITSEIDENYTKGQACVSSCTKTYEVNTHNEFIEESSGDATLVSKGDDPLNTELDDDNSLHSQENLPLDTDTIQNATSSERTKTKLTPKEKRKTFHERYRTYTIRDFKILGSTGVTETTVDPDKSAVKSTEEAEVSKTCVQNGLMFGVMKSTRNQDDVAWDIECNKENVDEKSNARDSLSKTLYRGRGHELLQFSKSFDKEKEYFSGFFFDSRSLNDLMSIGPSERKELADNAKLVAFSLKTAVQDWDAEFISDSESEEPQKSLEIDTATYTKTYRRHSHSRFSFQDLQSLPSLNDPCTGNLEKTGARILKPKDKAEDETSEELSKGIRGRRKQLYSSPQKNPAKMKGFSSSASSPKITPVMGDIKKPSPQQSLQSPILQREGTFTKEDGCILRKTEGKNVGAIPVLNRNSEPKNSSKLTTKNKSVASAGNGKAVGESKVSRIGRPLSSYVSKANDKRVEVDSSQKRPFSAGAGNRAVSESNAAAKKPASSSLVAQKMKNSSSTQNVKAGNSPGHGCSIKTRNLSSHSGKSQSDASLNLVDSKDKVSVGKLKSSKKEVTSKIAGLWRKVEETKERNKNLKDTRVWIGPEKNTTSNEALVMEKEEILHIPTRTIVHSFTCQALTEETCNDFTSQKRNSKSSDVTHDGIAEGRERIQKRGIISAVVAPYNYNPPTSVVTQASFKEVDNFQKSSLKITAV